MFLVAPPMMIVSSGFSAPSRSMTTKSFGGGFVIGYVRPGGYIAGQIGDSGGTLSGTLLAGCTTDAFYTDNNQIDAIFIGNAVSDLAGCTGVKINTTVCEIVVVASYDSGSDTTSISFDGSAILLTAPTTYTVQLV